MSSLADELHHRQIKQAIQAGKITPEEIQNAPVDVLTQTCACSGAYATWDNRCDVCGQDWTVEGRL